MPFSAMENCATDLRTGFGGLSNMVLYQNSRFSGNPCRIRISVEAQMWEKEEELISSPDDQEEYNKLEKPCIIDSVVTSTKPNTSKNDFGG